jgi:hypothetical protein
MAPTEEELRALPGSEIVIQGLADLEAGRETVAGAAVQAAATRLREAGLDVPAPAAGDPATHRLYARIAEADERNAHSRYNAILRRLASFARAAESARAR